MDAILVTAVNDVFVLKAWSQSAGADGKVEMLSDGNGDFVEALQFYLAWRIAPSVTGGDQFNLGEKARRNYAIALSTAAENAAAEERAGK